MALTQKQELFCREVAAGKSYKDAYITAYDTNGKDSTIYAESGKLAIREDIQERIKALQKPLEDAAKIQGLNAREKQLQEIEKRIAICEQKDDEQSLIRWHDMKNKILQLYTVVDDNKETVNNLSTLDTSILEKITRIG